MAEYIDREEAINEVLSCFGVEDSIFSDATIIAIGFKLKNIPAADVQPVKHGRWIRDAVYVDETTGEPCLAWFCNQCGEPQMVGTNFCPNCGAKMDGEVNG